MTILSNDEVIVEQIETIVGYLKRINATEITLQLSEVVGLIRCLKSFKALYEIELKKNNDRRASQP